MHNYIIYPNVSISGACGEVLLVWIYRKAFDCTLVCLETMPKRSLAYIEYADVSFLACRNQQLVLRCVDKTRSSLLVAGECYEMFLLEKPLNRSVNKLTGNERFLLRKQSVPETHVLAFGAVACSGNQAARSKEHEVGDAFVVTLIRLRMNQFLGVAQQIGLKVKTHEKRSIALGC